LKYSLSKSFFSALGLLDPFFSLPFFVKKSRIGGKQYLDYLRELGELLVYTIGGFGISVSLRYNCPYVVRIRGSSHPCANTQDVVK
jgi:hypothetical protein